MLKRQFQIVEDWLFDAAFPFWGCAGLDIEFGGFYEQFDLAGSPVQGVPRRTRVVARQIYAFAAAGRMGWQGDWRAVVDHGATALFNHCLRDDGLVLSTYSPDGGPLKTAFDFYDHAFALFALAEIAKLKRSDMPALKHAEAMLTAMEADFSHPEMGFAEDKAHSVPLRANPHMHLLEACLALSEINGASPRWRKTGDLIVHLAMTRFIQEQGFLCEFFDFHWQPMPDDSGRLIEPGHQFEWSWLLRWWNKTTQSPSVEQAAVRLAQIGERYGVNANGITIDELWDDFSVRANTARTWPQTERLKACLASASMSSSAKERAEWEEKAVQSIRAIDLYTRTPVAGLWHDRLDEREMPIIGSSPASTLYHIVCAMETCKNYLHAR